MKLSDFDYELRGDRIAQRPVEPRDAARLLLHDVRLDATEHRRVSDLPEVLRAGDLLVVNDTRVRHARLLGRRGTGGAVELLILGPAARAGEWRALVRPAKRLREGETLEIEGGALRARARERSLDRQGSPGAEWTLEIFDPDHPNAPLEDRLEQLGRMPLPPYIHRRADRDPYVEADRTWYQTVFARASGAVAAPTAGLHLTTGLLERLAGAGVATAAITLHVGPGTFRPVAVERIEDHRMHAEAFHVPGATAEAIADARRRGGRVVAVGTTSARALETCCDSDGAVRPGFGETRLFVTPGYRFRALDALITNFHLPRSTLLMLVAALAGRERILRLYEEAAAREYRFYSYGDAMLLLR